MKTFTFTSLRNMNGIVHSSSMFSNRTYDACQFWVWLQSHEWKHKFTSNYVRWYVTFYMPNECKCVFSLRAENVNSIFDTLLSHHHIVDRHFVFPTTMLYIKLKYYLGGSRLLNYEHHEEKLEKKSVLNG